MFKTFTAILAAAVIAAVATILLTPSNPVDAGPLPKPTEATLKSCVQRPWPYLNCVGTAVGNPHIRLVTTDQLPR